MMLEGKSIRIIEDGEVKFKEPESEELRKLMNRL